jgi:RNA recognition motif-containing protein
MSNELFVDGICEIDDKTIVSYFSRFGSRIKHYDSHRHRPTNSCCFALISFESHYTVNAILRRRPHSINIHPLFVKRLLPPNTCSFIERLLPVSSLFVYNKLDKKLDEQKLKNYFKTFGHILRFEHDYNRDRIFIEYDDYDSVDRIFLNKDHLPNNIDIHKNILPRAQSTVEYHGTCRRQRQNIQIDEKKKKRHHKKKSHINDQQYQDLLHKTIENLLNCKAELRNKENDYVLLQMGKII